MEIKHTKGKIRLTVVLENIGDFIDVEKGNASYAAFISDNGENVLSYNYQLSIKSAPSL